MFIEIIDELNWKLFPIDPESKHLAEVPSEVLFQIGMTMRFDMETNTAVPISESELFNYLELRDRKLTIENLNILVGDLKNLLDKDYRISKFLDGEYTESEWAEITKERREARKNLKIALAQFAELQNLPSPLASIARLQKKGGKHQTKEY